MCARVCMCMCACVLRSIAILMHSRCRGKLYHCWDRPSSHADTHRTHAEEEEEEEEEDVPRKQRELLADLDDEAQADMFEGAIIM